MSKLEVETAITRQLALKSVSAVSLKLSFPYLSSNIFLVLLHQFLEDKHRNKQV